MATPPTRPTLRLPVHATVDKVETWARLAPDTARYHRERQEKLEAALAAAFQLRHPQAVEVAAGSEQRFAALAAAEAMAGSGRVPTRFLPLGVLTAYGMLPRFGSKAGFVHPLTGEPNANLCRSRESFDPEKTTFVFVSHRWLLPGNGARGHPDDDQQRKFQLIVAALERLCGGSNTPVPEGMEVAVWVDYCCIDQDGAPASELDNLGGLIQACDLVLTPVVDVDHQEWDYPQLFSNWFVQYLAAGWREYWSRGWCRVEAMCAAVKPVDEGRAELFRGAVKEKLLAGHRPHVLFGTKELEERRSPIFLPPLLHSMFERYAPELGALTKEADRVAVRRLTEEARKDVVELVVGWVGEYRGEGVGRGKRVFADGGVQEGEFRDGQLHGHGKGVLASGSVYEGQWKEGKKHGKGRYAYASGGIYEGEWEADLRHGYGKFAYADGSSYEGEFQREQRHGKGKFTMPDGQVLISSFEAREPVGQGVKWSADRAQAWELQDGKRGRSISQEEAAQIAARIGLPVP